MTATLTTTGVQIETYSVVLDQIVESIGAALSLTAEQEYRVRKDVRSVLGNLARIDAEREAATQEAIALVYETLSMYAEGAALDRVVALLGVTRLGERFSQIVVRVAQGTSFSVSVGELQIRHDDTATTWTNTTAATWDGVTLHEEVTFEADDAGEVEITSGPWTVVTAPSAGPWAVVSGAIENQISVGAPIETDAQLRVRAGVEAYRRAQGSMAAIEANVQAVYGVTFVRAWNNRTNTTDANGIPGKAINVVVEGGTDALVAEAILASSPAGAEFFALSDGTQVSEVVVDTYGFGHTVNFNRIDDVELHIRCTLTTSTSETVPPEDVLTFAAETLLSTAQADFGIGDDVLPWRLSGALFSAGLEGVDAVLVELSLNGSSWSTAKRVMTIRQKPVFDAARITVQED